MGIINKFTIILCTLLLSLGILGAGYSVGKGIYVLKQLNRIVTVKGLAEKDVKADMGIWEIDYREVGNDLLALDKRLQHDQAVVTAFLKQQGFSDAEISITQLKVEDRLGNIYNQPTPAGSNDQRYVITAGIRIRSPKVDLIQKGTQLVNQLLQQGIPLALDVTGSAPSPNPSFYYIQLDSIRPEMLAAATQSARAIAEQFAKDSDSRLAGIQRASQGVFQIMGQDTSTMNTDWNTNQNALGSIYKKVRLVTTIDYRLR